MNMRINIISVGKIKEKFLKDAIDEYSKRLSKFCNLNIIEVNEYVAKVEDKSSIKKTLEEEGKAILSKVKNGYTVVLDIDGKEYSTLELSDIVNEIMLNGNSEISFIIGGSYGLSEDVKKAADLRLSFSRLTFPHQLFRLILIEQI